MLAQNLPPDKAGNNPEKIVTVVQTKELIKKEVVKDTVVIHDTIKIINYIREQLPDQNAEIKPDSVPGKTDPTAIAEEKKTNTIHFAMETGYEEGRKIRFGTKRYSRNEPEYMKPELTFKQIAKEFSNKNLPQ